MKKKGMTRREFMKSTAVAGVAAAAGTIGFPNVLRGADPKEILIGHIHPLSGALGFDGQELKKGMQLAVSTHFTFEVWLMVAVLYLVLTLTLSLGVSRLERRLRRSD